MSLAFLLSAWRGSWLAAWRRRQRPERVIDRAYPAWLAREPAPASWRDRVAALTHSPRFSIVMPVHDPDPAWLRAALDSVRGQIFAGWELLIADDASADPAVAACLAGCGGDSRIHLVRLPARGGIAAASNAALALADGDYVAFLDHDDVLAPHALAAMACAIADDPRLDLLFSDEDQLVEGRRARPYFKPGWNPDLLLSQNLVCHLALYRRTLVTALGGLRADMAGAQDHDLALRVLEQVGAHRIRHLPLVLYHWRQSGQSFSAVSAQACRDAAVRAVGRHLAGQARVQVDPSLPQWPDIVFDLPDPAPRVSLVAGEGFAVASDSYDPALIEYVSSDAAATGDVLLFLAPGLLPDGPDWIRPLVAQLCRDGVGVAGAKLMWPGGRWLHTGYVLHPTRIVQSAAPASDAGDPGYRGQFARLRTVSAVSGDCLAVRREVFRAAGGYAAAAGDFAAVDLCLRLAVRGLRTVWTPHASLHFTTPPRRLKAGAAWMRRRWQKELAADPYGNPNLGLRRGRVFLA